MDWEAIGAIGQVIGSIAVLITVWFLVVQIRQNNQALSVGAYQDFVARHIHVTDFWSRHADTLARLQTAAEITSAERGLLINLMSCQLRNGDALFYQYEQGLLDRERMMSALKSIAGAVSANPWTTQIWEEFQYRYASRYRSALNEQLNAST